MVEAASHGHAHSSSSGRAGRGRVSLDGEPQGRRAQAVVPLGKGRAGSWTF